MKINFDTDYEAYQLTITADFAKSTKFKAVYKRDAPNCAELQYYYIDEEYFESSIDTFWGVYLKTLDDDFVSINQVLELAQGYANNFRQGKEEHDRQKAHSAGE